MNNLNCENGEKTGIEYKAKKEIKKNIDIYICGRCLFKGPLKQVASHYHKKHGKKGGTK